MPILIATNNAVKGSDNTYIGLILWIAIIAILVDMLVFDINNYRKRK